MEPETNVTFHERFVELFQAHFHRLHRFVNRLSGDPEAAADVAQETFVRLYRRGSLPDSPEAWLITVAMNLLRSAMSTRRRRLELLTAARSEQVLGDPTPSPDRGAEVEDTRERVRAALERMPDRERRMLLLRAEGYSYRDIAAVLRLNQGSVGTLLARAKRVFRDHYEGQTRASG